MLVTNNMDDLLARGFARRMGKEYLDTLAWEGQSPLFDKDQLAWAHAHGFFAETVACLGITDENADDYLTDYDYFRVWPLNSWQRVWINDKLTLKYMFSGTDYDRYLPKCKNALVAGIAFEAQRLERVPRDEHDLNMEIIVTEKNIYTIKL